MDRLPSFFTSSKYIKKEPFEEDNIHDLADKYTGVSAEKAKGDDRTSFNKLC